MPDSWIRRQPTLLPGRALPADVVYIARAMWGGVFATMSIAIYSLYVVRDAALTPFELVIVGAVLEGATFLFEVPTGVVADVLSRRLSIVIGTALFGLGPIAFGLFPSFGGIVLGQIAFGVGFTFFSGAQEAWLADEIGEEAAARTYPRAAQWRQAGAVLGILAGAGLGLISHSLPFLVGGAAYSAFALFLAMTMPETGFRPREGSETQSSWAQLGATARGGWDALRSTSMVRAAFLVAFVVGCSSGSWDRLWSYHLLEHIGLPAGMNEVLFFGAVGLLTQAIGFVVVRAVRNATADVSRASMSRVLTVYYAAIAVATAAFVAAGSFWVALPALLVVECLRRTEPPFFTAWVNRDLDPSTRATVLSSVSQGNALGQLSGGPVFAVMAGAGGAVFALLAGAGIILPALPLVRSRPKDEVIAR